MGVLSLVVRGGRRACVLSLLAVAGCGGAAPQGGPSADRLPTAPYGDVETLLRGLFLPGADTDAYVAPSKAELARFDAVMSSIAARAFDAASSGASALGYDLWHVPDPAAPELVALVERPATMRGGGTFVVDTGSPGSHV